MQSSHQCKLCLEPLIIYNTRLKLDTKYLCVLKAELKQHVDAYTSSFFVKYYCQLLNFKFEMTG